MPPLPKTRFQPTIPRTHGQQSRDAHDDYFDGHCHSPAPCDIPTVFGGAVCEIPTAEPRPRAAVKPHGPGHPIRSRPEVDLLKWHTPCCTCTTPYIFLGLLGRGRDDRWRPPSQRQVPLVSITRAPALACCTPLSTSRLAAVRFTFYPLLSPLYRISRGPPHPPRNPFLRPSVQAARVLSL